MKVSILTPTYNDGESIIETLNSIKEQTYENWEHIIIIDGSTDNTEKIIKDYKKKNDKKDRIKYIKQENKDQLNALLNGLNHATGDFIHIIHSDDLLPSKDYFEKAMNEFKENPDLDSIIGDLLIINKDSEVTNQWKALDYVNKDYIPTLLLLNNGCNFYGDFGTHKKEVFENQIKNNYMTWNTPFWLDMDSQRILNIKKVDFPILKYRIYDNNYASNEIGKFNALNGEIRTITRVMNEYNIYFYKLQKAIFQFLRMPGIRKLRLSNKFKPLYKKQPTKNKYKLLLECIENTYKNKEYEKNIYLKSLLGFYKNMTPRTVVIEEKINEEDVYYGKDIRIFTKKLFDNKLPKLYYTIFEEMEKGFNRVIVKNKKTKEQICNIFKFLNIYPYVNIEAMDEEQKTIPKVIHYVWMGGKEKPNTIKKCMKTWKKRLKGYEFIEWNEKTFDVNSHPFVKAAYKAKKWAFVSDYVRAYAIYNYGGVYFDTDIFAIRDIEKVLDNDAFVGYEHPDFPFTAVFGAKKGHPLIKDMLDYYDKLDSYEFNFENNNTISVSNLLITKYKCKKGNQEQMLKHGIKVYKEGVLCNPSNESLTVHVFLGSWLDNSKFKAQLHEFMRCRLNNKYTIFLYEIYRKVKNIFKRK